ncbi:hypothetical protein SAMN05428949_1273 [Chitinophaga sp. YR627]|uniref:hypothetical protein n=1 Tax=Chitinophaga sp. YR627 TaxID=1881041 RepID=UPI0008E06730|nr:hypothetical protein [Chitinophaga sp. YR627]SFM91253.1 hypothetical protein SAMN05428949_1273 [Chitinophaga sp. YR627]
MVTIVKDIDRINELLRQYKGCNAQLWAYSVSLRRMAIRLWMDINGEQFLLLTAGTRYIQGYIDRENADITVREAVNEHNERIIIISDESADFKVIAGGGLILARGDFSEFNMHFDSLFDMEKAIFE